MSKLNPFILSLITFLSISALGDYKVGLYEIDPAHSRVDFVINHIVVSEVSGRFNDISGVFVIERDFSKSMLDAKIKATSIDTAISKRDDHLRSADFFDVKKYPTIHFKSKKIIGTPTSFKLIGDLTIKDVTKEVSFDGSYTGSAEFPAGVERAAFKATTTINRKHFNINYNEKVLIGPAVGDEVKITIRSEGILKSKE